MKCNEAEIYILLQGSGELGETEGSSLEDHLAGCAPCRQFRQVMIDSENALAEGIEPPVRAVQDVKRAARVYAPAPRKIFPVFGLRPVLAMTASFVVIMGLLVGNYPSDRIGMELRVTDAQMMDPADQVVSIMYDGLSEDDLAFNFLMTYEGNAEG